MEPFALFNLLKTFLPQTENLQNQAPVEPTQPNPNTQEKNTPPIPTVPTSVQSNSFLDFAERHDERAKRIKKK